MGVFSWKNFKKGIQNHMRHVKKNMNNQVDRVMNKVVDQAKKHMSDRPKQLTFVNKLENPITRANPLRIGHQQKEDLPVFNSPQGRNMKKSRVTTDKDLGRNQNKAMDSRRHVVARNILKKQNI